VSGGGAGAGVVGTGSSVKAFDTTSAPSASWFKQAYADGFRLYVLSGNTWGQNAPWPQASGLCKLALDAGLKIAAYTRNPRWWKVGIEACAPYIDQLQFFCLDIEDDPGVPVTRAMVDGVKAMGVRPVIYSGWSLWPTVMGDDNEDFADLPLWDADTHGAHWDPATYTPTLTTPKPRPYGGWNTPTNMHIGLQQTENAFFNEVNINISSFSEDFLR
jgi:hypothetical protein